MGGAKFKMPSNSDSQLKAPYYKLILKHEHADDEEFDAKSFPFEELIPRWKGELFDAHLMNAATGRIFTNKHHTKGEGLKKRSNYEAFDFAFCLEWIDRAVEGGDTVRDRCYNQFTIKSQGCCDHPKCEFKDGPNMVYYRMVRGDLCNWGMLKDHQASVPKDDKKTWTYTDWQEYAERLAMTEQARAEAQGIEDYYNIVPDCMADFEAWWRFEGKIDAKHGGTQAANARGYSLIGTRTNPPEFMSPQAGNETLPNLSRLTLSESSAPRVANSRAKFGKDASNGRPDLDAKRTHYQRGKKTKGAADKDTSLPSLPKDRKPLHADKIGGRTVGA